mmetsp:Transcript_7983/g.17250  ORF Transcript_7983/g.17250 Transcript_7983/m.17250 type:complete len:402 (+) Transcript_7983:123-1328(+)
MPSGSSRADQVALHVRIGALVVLSLQTLAAAEIRRSAFLSGDVSSSSSLLQVDTESLEADPEWPYHGLCMQKKLFPQLWLLGAQKCATSLLAVDLMALGVKVNTNDGSKEAHFFDKWVNDSVSGPEATAEEKRAWLRQLPDCTPGTGKRRLLADFTPSNLRNVPLPAGTRPTGSHWGSFFLRNTTRKLEEISGSEMNVPQLLKTFYGPAASKTLTFVVMIREPLARMQSNWYHASQSYSDWKQCRDCKSKTFAGGLEATLHKARQAQPIYDDWLWTSLYARHMERWLEHFDASQFYVIPVSQYSQGNRTAICKDLADRMTFPMECQSLIGKRQPVNTHEHPPLETDVSEPLRKSYADLLQSENQHLVKLLASAHNSGAGLAGYEGPPGDEDAVRKWLHESW